MRLAFSKTRKVTSSENALYKLETVRDEDWDILIWISSQMKWEIYAYLFIVIWNNTEFGEDRMFEFREETMSMIRYVRKLNKSMCIDDRKAKEFINLFNDYRDYRIDNYFAERNRLISFVLRELEAHGLKNKSDFYEQLKVLPMKQKKKLRGIVIDRMKVLIDMIPHNDKSLMNSGKNDKNNLKDELDALKNEKDILCEQIFELQKENSKYQAAQGNLTNLGFSDEDPNNIFWLNKDIKTLQDLLGDFTLVSGPEYEIDVTKCNELLSFYKCNVEVESQHGKQILSAALQRLTIETIIVEAKNFFLTNSFTIEANLVTKTKEIVDLTNSFTKEYAENDEIAKAIPTKIRQQVHSMLGSYAFSYDEHPLLKEISEIVLKKLNQYRQVIDDDEDNEIIPIIRKIVQLFFYQLGTHPITPVYQFYENSTKMNPLFMESAGTRSKDMKKLEVEICSFLVIAIFDTVNDKPASVFSKALIIPKPKSSNNTSLETAITTPNE
ncbi:hypothetical protein C2G38_2256330 [Gigaspora rosea]|uniref:Uncharacterized protein n=1 Tax=Gigaspora rosea TaxID=44941 RepID=A0A397TTN1_9GLOM|nr:hypothetical protein C2G38_2256330 [Gigaspora rosea]CAG8458253.1 9556_t:CDS:1 [Gigaspora rosea]